MNFIDEFLGSRCITDEVKSFFEENAKPLDDRIYRGLPFPYPMIKVGAMIDEWHNCSHWSLERDIADKFAVDYINEDYSEEVQELFDMSEEELFVPMVMVLDECPKVIEMYKFTKEFSNEKEITVVGYNFEITSIESEIPICDDLLEDKEIVVVKVKAVPYAL